MSCVLSYIMKYLYLMASHSVQYLQPNVLYVTITYNRICQPTGWHSRKLCIASNSIKHREAMCIFDKIHISLWYWTMKSKTKSKHSCFGHSQTTTRIMYHITTWHGLCVTLKNDCTSWHHIGWSVQERCNSIANAQELHLSCTNPSISWGIFTGKCVVWDD